MREKRVAGAGVRGSVRRSPPGALSPVGSWPATPGPRAGGPEGRTSLGCAGPAGPNATRTPSPASTATLTLDDLLWRLGQPKQWRGRRVRALRPLGDDSPPLEAVSCGEFTQHDFRNRDVQAKLFPPCRSGARRRPPPLGLGDAEATPPASARPHRQNHRHAPPS